MHFYNNSLKRVGILFGCCVIYLYFSDQPEDTNSSNPNSWARSSVERQMGSVSALLPHRHVYCAQEGIGEGVEGAARHLNHQTQTEYCVSGCELEGNTASVAVYSAA